MSRTKSNPLRYLAFKLIKEKSFQKKLNVISEYDFPHFEKWFQVELACFFKINNCNHFYAFEWMIESTHEKGGIIPDFTTKFIGNGNEFYTEIKQHNGFITCLRNMVNDFNKVKNVVGIPKCMNINCIGIYKTKHYCEGKLSNLKDEYKRHKYLTLKLNKLKIKEIPKTEYSLMYF